MSGSKKLTPKQQRFVDEYLIDFNGTQAAIRAGYSKNTAESQASTLLRNPKVKAAVDKGREIIASKSQMSAEQVLRLAEIHAALDVRKLYDDSGRPKPISELDDETAKAIQGLSITTIGNKDVGVGEVLAVSLANRQQALDKLFKFHGLYEQDNKQKTDPIKDLLKAVSGSGESRGILDDVKERTQGGGNG